jgi:hypothetical protein
LPTRVALRHRHRAGGAAPMNDILAAAVATHGGLPRWEACTGFVFELEITGPMLEALGLAGTSAVIRAEGSTRQPLLLLHGLDVDARVARVSPGAVIIENGGGGLVRTWETGAALPADTRLSAIFCLATALWSAVSTPFAFARPGAHVVPLDLGRARCDGQVVRLRLDDETSGFLREAQACLDADSLLRRLIHADPVSATPSQAPRWLQLFEGHVVFDGLVVATLQRIHRITDEEGAKPSNLALAIKVRSARFY